jgi:hypothetical protein
MTFRAALATLVFGTLSAALPAAVRQEPRFDVVPVGVQYTPDPDPVRRKTDLETMLRLRFTVAALHPPVAGTSPQIVPIDRLLAGDTIATVTTTMLQFGSVQVDPHSTSASVRRDAWSAFARSATCVMFHDWKSLQQNDAALAEAAAFAETLARNPALYAPLRRVDRTGDRAITIEGSDSVTAAWLESEDALLLIAVNRAAEPREVTLTFASAVPEAVWQNMLTGASVNFVAGPAGPVYRRTFAADDVLVLMIRKRWK